jgi:hypothetical protein
MDAERAPDGSIYDFAARFFQEISDALLLDASWLDAP